MLSAYGFLPHTDGVSSPSNTASATTLTFPIGDGCLYGQLYSSITGKLCDTTNSVISSVSGLQSLNVNQTGTWKVNASSSNGGTLSYSVDWGDVV